MNLVAGILRKMRAALSRPIEYIWVVGEHTLPVNEYLGKLVTFRFTGHIFCIQCGRKTSQSFQQGYCFPCLQRLLECDLCTIHPEKCHSQHGLCPENDWAHAQCNQAHIVYLANSSGLKVGVTRLSQVPARWIDQGAGQALPIFQTKNRYQAGMIEVCLKQWMNDRTDWRLLLKKTADPLNLLAERTVLLEKAADALLEITAQFPAGAVRPIIEEEIKLEYPVLEYPQKISALSFDKTPLIRGYLQGIKGQYLIFDSGVINIRKFSGYEVELHV